MKRRIMFQLVREDGQVEGDLVSRRRARLLRPLLAPGSHMQPVLVLSKRGS